ncbi:unnamed protein product, partial [marine sediment metagenome]
TKEVPPEALDHRAGIRASEIQFGLPSLFPQVAKESKG